MSDSDDSVQPTSEQARAIQLYCRQQMRLQRLAESDGLAISKKRKEAQEARKALRTWIHLHSDFPEKDVDEEKRAYTYVTPEHEKLYVRLAKTTSTRNLTPETVTAAIQQLTSDEIEQHLSTHKAKMQAKKEKAKPKAKKQKTSTASDAAAATTTSTTTTSELDDHVSMREAVMTTLLVLIRNSTRKTLLNPEVTTSKPRGWGKAEPPLLPSGWQDSVHKICNIKSELQELDPVYKRKRKEITVEVEKQQELIEPFFEQMPANNRMQPVILKPDEVDTEVKIAESSGALTSGSQLQYLTMVKSSTSKKLTAANAMPAIEKAVEQTFPDAATPFTKETFEEWRSKEENIKSFTTLVHEMMTRVRTEHVESKTSLKLSSTLKSGGAARAYRKGDSDDDDAEDDEDDADDGGGGGGGGGGGE